MTGCQLRCVTAVIVAVSATALLASPDRAGRQTTAANDQARDSRPIPLATGSGVTALSEPRRPVFGISSYGAVSKGPALANQKAINDAIAAAAAAGGGTVVVPAGDFKTYTIRLRGRVGLHFATRQSIVRAAVHGPAPQGDGGVYDAPEQNLFVGLQDHGHGHWANSLIYGVDVQEYRGGLKMEHAIEQRQINEQYTYTGYRAARRASRCRGWSIRSSRRTKRCFRGSGGIQAPTTGRPTRTTCRKCPEPGNFGILPAYELYARHVRGLSIRNVALTYLVEDQRPAVVLEDVETASFEAFTADVKPGVPAVVQVTNSRKREPGREYVKNHSYRTTSVRNVRLPRGMRMQEIIVSRPAPGTPPDSFYPHPTAPGETHPYAYSVPDANYPKPRAVYRPFFDPVRPDVARIGQTTTITVSARSPIGDVPLWYSAAMLPAGATFDPAAGRLTWTPGANQSGRHVVRFTADDGVLPVHLDVTIQVEAALNHIGQSPLHADALSWWRPVLFGALAGGMGWGIRGQYGHETGAMIAGLLVSLVLVKICCPHAALLPAARAVAWTTIAIGFSGAMTYGQTIGLTQDPALVGNYAALRWGLLGLAIKGGIWIGFAGVFLGMGLGGVRYRARCWWSCWPCWCCSSPASAW